MPNNLEGVRQELLTALPDSVDRERLLAAVTRILGRPLLAPAKLVAHYEDQADGIRRFAANQRSLPSLDFVDRHGLLQQLAVQEQYCRRHAEAYKGLSIKHPPVFARQVELLFEFELCGGDVADYKRGRKREDDPHWPDPKGTVISYLRIAAGITAGAAHNTISKYRRLKLTALAQNLMAGGGLFKTNEDKIWMIDKDGRTVDRDGRIIDIDGHIVGRRR